MDSQFLLYVLLVGGGVGLISNALGLGGGIVMVPAFLTVVPAMDINTAKGSSLFIIVFVAAINTWRFWQYRPERSGRLAASLAAGSVAGGYAAGWATARMPEAAVTLLFIGLLFLLAARTFLLQPTVVRATEVRRRDAVAVAIGLATGVFSGATGTGGGAVFVPLALLAGIVSNDHVVALSNMVMVITCTAAALAHFLADRTTDLPWIYGQVDVALAPIVLVGAFATGPVGRRINRQLTLERRRLVMSILLTTIAIRLIARLCA